MEGLARALQWISGHEDELIARLVRLVSIPSVVGSEGPCQQMVAEWMRQACDSIDLWEPDASWLERHPAYFLRGVDFTGRPNVVGRLKGSGGGRSIILNAHVDVVDPGPLDAWQYPPWSGAIADGRLYGRGAVDDKAGLALITFVAQCLRSLGLALRGDVILESTVDEEWGGGGTLATIQRGYGADAAIVFEPTALEICPAARGGQAFRVTVPGKGAHPFRSYEGVSALEKAVPLLAALKGLEAERQDRLRTPLFERFPIFLPIVIGRISADVIPSKVPERCVFEGLMGYAPDEGYAEARRELEACVAGAASADPWLKEHPPVVEWLGLNKEGARTPADHPCVASLGEAFTRVTGRRPTVVGFPAGCDLPHLRNHAGIPSVVFGPGNLIVAHGSNEHVEIAEVVSAAKIVAAAVLQWCGEG
ncbi:MAG TPA: ArgE/DapE family deacylase [Candidatus Methylomirabilis sp.]|nr:ArgE/DapE family deacylase [Candidatus Methylomirabilis sp.]